MRRHRDVRGPERQHEVQRLTLTRRNGDGRAGDTALVPANVIVKTVEPSAATDEELSVTFTLPPRCGRGAGGDARSGQRRRLEVVLECRRLVRHSKPNRRTRRVCGGTGTKTDLHNPHAPSGYWAANATSVHGVPCGQKGAAWFDCHTSEVSLSVQVCH